jgi:hypothetical protein
MTPRLLNAQMRLQCLGAPEQLTQSCCYGVNIEEEEAPAVSILAVTAQTQGTAKDRMCFRQH